MKIRCRIASVLFVFFVVVITSCIIDGGGDGNANDPTYTVTYEENNSTGGSVPVDATGYEEGESATVPGNSGFLLKINVLGVSYGFAGWNTQENGNGTTFKNETLFAKRVAYTYRDRGPAGGPATSYNTIRRQKRPRLCPAARRLHPDVLEAQDFAQMTPAS